jgi:uncharacterized BrkB/YihY/UPF0761 family membrane protein
MSAKRVFQSLKELFTVYGAKRIARSAAGLSYFLTLSLFPFLICLNAVADLVHFDDNDFLAVMQQFIPQNALSVIQDYLNYVSSNRSGALLIAGLLVMVTSSSAGSGPCFTAWTTFTTAAPIPGSGLRPQRHLLLRAAVYGIQRHFGPGQRALDLPVP